ncbi:hypothetical protein CPB84DRAFT_1846572 [Gymnopilus junonius]|uniref:Uncharacterized protein n=1 Tax=Gymnopilus junonius TaxID=109634 RepID=A0A9P5TMP6_GYMJU|nr:hypothetical protein CPB84DRAFT_1846572 [Gymnopilus junonius]
MSRSRTTASGKKAPTKMQVHIQRNIDNFKRSRPHGTKGPEVMRQYVEYMDQEHFVRKDELESSIEVVIPHVPVPRKDTADEHDIQYGYSLQEISEMSLQDLFGRDAAGREPVSGVLLLGHKNPERLHGKDSDTEETDTKPDTTVKKRQAKKKKNKKGIKSQNGSADTPHGLPSPNVASDTSNLALQNLLERMQRMETELDGHKRIAEEERRKAEEERQRADEERQRAEEERKKADEERQRQKKSARRRKLTDR